MMREVEQRCFFKNAVLPVLFTLLIVFLFISLAFASEKTAVSGTVQEKKGAILTPEEKAWVQAHPVIRLAATPNWPPFEMKEADGSYAGISADFIRLASHKTGLEIEPVFDSKWRNHVERLQKHELDVAPGLNETPDRKKFLIFTEPFIEYYSAVFLRNDRDDIHTLDNLADKTVALEKGYAVTETIKAKYPDITILLTDSTFDAIKAISFGQADAYIGNQVVASYLIKKFTLTNLKAIEFYNTDIPGRLRFGIRKDWPVLQSILQKGLEAISTEERNAILDAWLDPNSRLIKKDMSLSQAERKWLADHQNIRLGIDPQWPPFEFLNPTKIYSGIASDYVAALNKRLETDMRPVAAADWSEVISKARNREIDVLPCLAKTPERSKYLVFTKSYISFPVVILTRDNAPFIKGVQDFDDDRIVVLKDYAAHEYLKRDYPDKKLNPASDIGEALLRVADGKADAFAGNLASITYAVQKLGLTNLKIATTTQYTYDLAFGVRKDWPFLAAILDKGIDAIPETEKQNIHNRWINVRFEKQTDWTMVWRTILLTVSVFGIIIAVTVYWNRRLAAEVAERKRIGERLRISKKEAEAANRAKSDFVANMSHEIRTPMNSVIGFLDLALEKGNLNAEHRSYLTTARNSGNALLAIINDILDVSKLESGRLEIEKISLNLNKTVEDAITTLKPTAEEKNLFLELRIHENVPTDVMGDPGRLRQIIINLTGNAIKFTDKGGVTVDVRPQKDDIIRFSITDTGIGIPEERLGHIFEPFTQADASTSRRFGGTGLGTTISRQLTELMGGRMWVESKVGVGSTFFCEIPMPAAKAAEEECTVEEPDHGCEASGPGRCFSILLAEDIEENIMLARIRMEQQEHRVIVARNGIEAVREFEREKPDIILMDVHMPEMDGLEATRKIRELEAGSGGHVPIVALTASVMKDERDKCLSAGMDAVAGKPVDFEELFELMEKLVTEGAGELIRPSESVETPGISSDAISKTLKGVDTRKGLQIWQNEAVYMKALLGFARDFGNAADKMRILEQAGDADSVQKLAHAIKGLAGNLAIPEVYSIAAALNNRNDEESQEERHVLIKSLGQALSVAVNAIHQLKPVTEIGETPQKDLDAHEIEQLFIQLMNAFETYNPAEVLPFISRLGGIATEEQLRPIREDLEAFDFDSAREKTVRLSQVLGLNTEAEALSGGQAQN